MAFLPKKGEGRAVNKTHAKAQGRGGKAGGEEGDAGDPEFLDRQFIQRRWAAVVRA